MSLVEDLKADFNKPVPKDFKERYLGYVSTNFVKYQKVAELINIAIVTYCVASGLTTVALLLLALWLYILVNQIYHMFKGG